MFRWGDWGLPAYSFDVHPTSVNSMLRIDESAVCTSSDDGLIRFVCPDIFSFRVSALSFLASTFCISPLFFLQDFWIFAELFRNYLVPLTFSLFWLGLSCLLLKREF